MANYKVKETPTVTVRCSVIGRRCWRSTLWLPRRTGVVSLGKGGKLQGKGDANRYGKVFSDRPPLLEVHAVVAEAYGCCVFPRRLPPLPCVFACRCQASE